MKMDIESFRIYCLSKPETTEGFPFDESTLVFKVAGKMFALTGLDSAEFKVNLKCDPDWAEELREEHEEIQPGYHMSKKHWNTVDFEGGLSIQMLKKLIDHSYLLVVKGLKKAEREQILSLIENDSNQSS
jgi:predicted DNA-binding protein (MmcQ/YjbR family)